MFPASIEMYLIAIFGFVGGLSEDEREGVDIERARIEQLSVVRRDESHYLYP